MAWTTLSQFGWFEFDCFLSSLAASNSFHLIAWHRTNSSRRCSPYPQLYSLKRRWTLLSCLTYLASRSPGSLTCVPASFANRKLLYVILTAAPSPTTPPPPPPPPSSSSSQLARCQLGPSGSTGVSWCLPSFIARIISKHPSNLRSSFSSSIKALRHHDTTMPSQHCSSKCNSFHALLTQPRFHLTK